MSTREQNAYVTKKGKRYQVRHGGTGQLLKSFKSKAKADAHMRALHKKHKPAASSRGVRAKRRVEGRRNNPERHERRENPGMPEGMTEHELARVLTVG